MGTKKNLRRNARARRRGLATFVSFVMLFAFALGQGSSLLALADDGVLADEAALTESASTDGSTEASADASTEAPAEETAPVEEAPAEGPAEEAPAEEEPAVQPADEPAVEESGVLSAASSPRRSGKLNTARVGGTDDAVSLAAPEDPDPGPPTTTLEVQPEFVDGNPTCSTLIGGDDFLFERKIEPVSDVEDLELSFGDLSGSLDVDVRNTADGQVFDFDVDGDFVVAAVFVKGGSGGNLYDYRPDGANAPLMIFDDPGLGDTALHAPINPSNDSYFGLSHLSFCIAERVFNPDILVEKTCPEFAQVGDEITYTIRVTNTGDEDLEAITVEDTILGNLSGSFANTLAAGAFEEHDFPYTVQAGDDDPLVNEVTATGTGVSSAAVVDSTDTCETDLVNPDILVEKSCPDFAQVGDEITYTIRVTNTGDEDLEAITVEDTILGNLSGSFANTLAAGAFEEHDFPYTVQAGDDDPLVNEVTATGTGVSSAAVVDSTDTCETDLVNPDILVEKTCESLAHVGDEVTYSITVTNTGDEDLEDVTVMDTVLGDLSDSFADTLAEGDSESNSFPYTIQADDDDPLENVVTATGTGVTSEDVVDDTANCETDIIHPAILIEKTVSDEIVPVGTTVTYTYLVTNTGDTPLFDITVVDDVMGFIGEIPFLDVGDDATLTKDFQVGDAVVINVAVAEGEDETGRSVSDDDDAIVTPIAGEQPPSPTPPASPTAFTGSDAGRLGLITMVLFGIGVTVVAATRRRRPEREAA